jgi:hypothetical protein
MKDDTKVVLNTLISAMKLQNEAMKQMARQIQELQQAIADWDARMATPTEIHNHYHNERQPLGPPTPIPVTTPVTRPILGSSPLCLMVRGQ